MRCYRKMIKVVTVTLLWVRCITHTCDWLLYYNNMSPSVLFVTYFMLEGVVKPCWKSPPVPEEDTRDTPCCAASLSWWSGQLLFHRIGWHSWESIPVRKHSVFNVLASHSLAFSSFFITRHLLSTTFSFSRLTDKTYYCLHRVRIH